MARRPEVDGGRCVHGRIETASCRACVDACPRQAWRLDDDGLGLDEAACDGCGLCVAACPPGAIGGLALTPALRRIAGRPALLAACERITEETGDGLLPCLHAIGFAALLEAWRRGERVWLVATGACEACPRGHGARLEGRIALLNSLFQARGLAEIHLRHLGPGSFAALLASHGGHREAPPPDGARRGWLGMIRREDTESSPAPQTLGEYFTGHGPLPWTLRLDTETCVACHACVQVCPAGALARQDLAPHASAGLQAAYRLDHARCNGCNLCRDVCARDAIHPTPWSRPVQAIVFLGARRCPSCGATFHYPADRPNPPTQCWVCAGGKPAGRLYQVME